MTLAGYWNIVFLLKSTRGCSLAEPDTVDVSEEHVRRLKTQFNMHKTIISAVLLIAFIVSSAVADENTCKSLADVENYWKSYLQNTAEESRVNASCRQNRQALKLMDLDAARKGAEKSDGDEVVDERKKCAREFLSLIHKLCLETEQTLGLFHLDEARKSAKVPGQEEATNEHRKLARDYLGDAVVEKELPEVIILKPRNMVYEFELKKGEQTSSWIEGEIGTTTHLHFFHTTNYAFEVRYKNGYTVRVWDGEKVPKKPDGPFKIVATDATIVLIMVD